MTKNQEINTTLGKFNVKNVLEIIPFGSGHINDTYKITTDSNKYILQKINTEIFKDTKGMMHNIQNITEHLDKKGKKTYKVIDYDDQWRLISFIENTHSVDVLSNTDQAFTAAKAFATFQNDLADFPAENLVETIPNFHNTVFRLQQLDDALNADVMDRLKNIQPEMTFVDAHRNMAPKILNLIEEGKIPVRITHNDTKINNVMLDNNTEEAVAVVDLDTVMPGCALYDFGDMVRTATAAAEEDEKDLSKVYSKKDFFEALVRGYLSEAKFLNKYEIDNLVFSGKLITFTIGIRFLTDYLAGDHYFKIDHPEHNLIRARTQFKMVESIEEQEKEYKDIVRKVSCNE